MVRVYMRPFWSLSLYVVIFGGLVAPREVLFTVQITFQSDSEHMG